MSDLPKGWVETTLGEVALIVMGQSPKGESYNEIGDGLPFYQGVTEFGERFVSIKKYTDQPTKIVNKNTILFSVRAPVGRVNFVKHKACIGRGNAGMTIRKGEQNFLFYLLKQIEKHIQSYTSGTVFTSISGKELATLSVTIPKDKDEQKAIAAVLSAFDNKIELLREQNRTLETFAQTIFKEWFVHFNFPDKDGKPYRENGGEMVDSELGEIPKGWRVGRLSEIAEFINGLALQKYPPIDGEETLLVIKIRELNKGFTVQTDRANTKLDKKYIIHNGDIIFSWSGSLEVVIWKYGKGALNQHLFKVSSDNYPKWFYYYWTLFHLREFRVIASNKATTMGHIQRKHLDEAKVFLPDNELMNRETELFSSLIGKLILNNAQIQTLSKTRDTLLPKLMNGEIRVNVSEV